MSANCFGVRRGTSFGVRCCKKRIVFRVIRGTLPCVGPRHTTTHHHVTISSIMSPFGLFLRHDCIKKKSFPKMCSLEVESVWRFGFPHSRLNFRVTTSPRLVTVLYSYQRYEKAKCTFLIQSVSSSPRPA